MEFASDDTLRQVRPNPKTKLKEDLERRPIRRVGLQRSDRHVQLRPVPSALLGSKGTGGL